MSKAKHKDNPLLCCLRWTSLRDGRNHLSKLIDDIVESGPIVFASHRKNHKAALISVGDLKLLQVVKRDKALLEAANEKLLTAQH